MKFEVCSSSYIRTPTSAKPVPRARKEFSQAGAEFVEDKSLESEIKTGHDTM